jgi:glycosyltransferase involved in cell wall biosynthesis
MIESKNSNHFPNTQQRRIFEDPRNLWTRFQAILHFIKCQEFYSARQALDGLRYHASLPDSVYAGYERLLAHAMSSKNAVHRINKPSDYLSSTNQNLLRPFRKLNPDANFPKPYPWAMSLPAFVGAGNDYRFLQESATQLAGTYKPSILKIHIIIIDLASNTNTDDLIDQLTEIDHSGNIEATAFSQLNEDIKEIPGFGSFTMVKHEFLSKQGNNELIRITEKSDLLVFLSGKVVIDPMLLQRARHIAEISDSVLMPLIALPVTSKFNTLYSTEDLRQQFSTPYPFRQISSLNMIVPARLLRTIGLPDIRFKSSVFAAKELAYRAYVKGAWLIPISVNGIEDIHEKNNIEVDLNLYKNCCPNHWDRKVDTRYEVAKVSIYIPAYNASKYIERAIESVLNQDINDIDICIANDGSPDDTLALLERRYSNENRVRWINNPNGGIGFASNSAIRMSKSLYIGQLDSDDCLKPGAVRRMMSFLDEHPAVDCAYASCERIDAAGNFTQDEYSWPIFSREKMMITSIAHHFRMFRRQAWERTYHFREDIVNGVDYDIFLKLSEVGKFHHIDEKYYQRRWHGENTSHVNENHQTTNTHRVQREALKRTGLACQWDLKVLNPDKPRNVTYALRPGTKMVIFWPDYSQSNPYQRLLYSKIRQATEVVAGSLDAAMRVIDTKTASPENTTFHLHWLNFLFKDIATENDAEVTANNFIKKIQIFIEKGGRFIWTIHNTVSHDTPFSAVETSLSARLAECAHAVHIHSAASLPEIMASFPISREKVRVSRHGHYIGVYPNFLTRESARSALGIAKDSDVILFTGQIRPYKGVETLIEVFRQILAKRPKTFLLLAGKSEYDPIGKANLSEIELSRIIYINRFIENDELQIFFKSADIAVYPYNKVLTSGSLLLALSFGIPTIVPRVGMTSELIDNFKAGQLYDASSGKKGLEIALLNLLNAKNEGKLENLAKNATKAAIEMTWPEFRIAIE